MKGIFHPKNDLTINPTQNESIRDVLQRVDHGRRQFIKTSLATPVLAALGGISIGGLVKSVSAAPVPPGLGFEGIGFESIPPSLAVLDATGDILIPVADQVKVPSGYDVRLLASWGDPVVRGGRKWDSDVSQGAGEQAKQFGMHNDGMHYFPLPFGPWNGRTSRNGLLAVNHEYTHESILHPDGLDEATGGLAGSVVTIEKIRKSQAAHGITVMEIHQLGNRRWEVFRNSSYGRRITANTPINISGAAAGHDLLKFRKYDILPSASVDTRQITDGTKTWGTANNCANGYTPWGTYLTCEENWNGYFGWKGDTHVQTKLEKRYGVVKEGFGVYKWHHLDDRFDTEINPNQPNAFGWVVEIDPYNPNSTPVKRTSLGRAKWESAGLAEDPDHSFGFYLGDDERNEYLYKWVCNQPYNPNSRAANRDLLDHGTLYVAQFTSDPGSAAGTYRGRWIPLVPDTDTVFPGEKLRDLEDFASADDADVQALICVKTRMAADAVGATMMDRPEWTTVRPRIGGYTKLEGYVTLTNNNRRGSATPPTSNSPDGSTSAGSARPAVDVANPRPDNDYGHIIRWREDGSTIKATEFEWDIFVQCGDTRADEHVPGAKTLPGSYDATGHDGYEGSIHDVPDGSADFGAPDGLWFDYYGRLWIQTDQQGDGAGDWQKIGSNTMLCADPNSKEIVRFLTSPPQCEVTGVAQTPDGKTMFVGIQHPGEEAVTSNPTEFSDWPHSQFDGPAGRPRSSVLAITRRSGGIIGASREYGNDD
jgi:secreted PhoX family phosphatase